MAGFGDFTGKANDALERIDKLTATMERLAVQNDQLHSIAYREFEPFIVVLGGVTADNKALTVSQQIMSNGWEGYVSRVAVTCSGASQAAQVSLYRNAAGPSNLIDYSSALYAHTDAAGNSFAKNVADYNTPPYFRDDDLFVAVLTGSAAAGNAVTYRVEGKRRQA